MSAGSKNRTLPQPGYAEGAATTVKALRSLMPGGGAAAELLSLVLAPALTSRRDKWLQELADDLTALEDKVAHLNRFSLKDNDEFISTFLHATQIALRSHQDEKRKALRNAVLNVASGNAPDDDLQLMFLSLIDGFTTRHLSILRFFQDPRACAERSGAIDWSNAAPSMLLEHTFPELKHRRAFYDQIVRHLQNEGLLDSQDRWHPWLHDVTTAEAPFAKRTTSMGDRFLKFITSPLE